MATRHSREQSSEGSLKDATIIASSSAVEEVSPSAAPRRSYYIYLWWLLFGAIVAGIGVVSTLGIVTVHEYQGRVLPNVAVAGLPVGGMTRTALRDALQSAFERWDARGVEIRSSDQRMILNATVSAPGDPDLTHDLYTLNVDATVDRVFSWGRRSPIALMGYIVRSASPINIAPVVDIHASAVEEVVRGSFASLNHLPRYPRLEHHSDGTFGIIPEHAGVTVDTDALMRDLSGRAGLFGANAGGDPISLRVTDITPDVTVNDVMPLWKDRSGRLTDSSWAFADAGSGKQWNLSIDDMIRWNQFERSSDGSGRIVLAFHPSLQDPLIAAIAHDVNTPAYDAKFVMNQGRVETFQESRAGTALDVVATAEKLTEAVNDSSQGASSSMSIPLVIQTIEPSVTTAQANTLGIRELVGTGRSNFSGSPHNRRLNIAQGVKTLNGTLIAPGQEFSLVKALGPIDETTGYFPELVIKDNKTIPEFGGGLCQIGTTTFRAALDAGLPITERQNHSYRVRYYEPAGTDATIYPLHPDLRFVNDTAASLLLLTFMDKNDLRFEFWGTRDGRQAHTTKPTIGNIRKPPPTKLIKTLDLKPGERKCTEHAHDGATAQFTYTVIMPDGSTREKVFRSYYRPWQEVCLLGVTKEEFDAEQKNADETASSSSPASVPSVPTPATLPSPDQPTVAPSSQQPSAAVNAQAPNQ